MNLAMYTHQYFVEKLLLLKSPSKINRFFGRSILKDKQACIRLPDIEAIALMHKSLEIPMIKELIISDFLEIRLLALYILIASGKDVLQFYLEHIVYLDNWNLIDRSASQILGKSLHHVEHDLLFQLAKSNLWTARRIALVATQYFIERGYYSTTIQLCQMLLHDQHDLVQKAIIWMLKEIRKRDDTIVQEFIKANTVPKRILTQIESIKK